MISVARLYQKATGHLAHLGVDTAPCSIPRETVVSGLSTSNVLTDEMSTSHP